MELYKHSNVLIWGIKILTGIKLKSMLLAFFLGGFSNCFCFLTTRQMFEDEMERLHLFSAEDKKQEGSPSFFSFEVSFLCRKSIYKSITLIQYRPKKVLKGFLKKKGF